MTQQPVTRGWGGTTPRVTVLLNVHNGIPFLRSALESVLAQSFSDFELLVVDDASTDGTHELVESFADLRIRLCRNDRNLGIARSLNRGLEQARGEYVAHFDHDDLCLPGRLGRQVAVLDREPQVAIVGTWVDVIDEEGAVIGRARGTIADFAEFVFLLLVDKVPLFHTSVMFRRQAALDLGGYDVSLPLTVDQDLYRRIALAKHEARVVPEPLVRYRTHLAQQSKLHPRLQRECDDASYEQFIVALSSHVPARAIHLLLAGELDFWDGCSFAEARSVGRALESLLDDASHRLQLSSVESALLERRIGARVGRVALGGWRRAVAAQWRTAPPLWWFGLRRAGFRRAPALAAGFAAVSFLAPILFPLRATERRALRRIAARPWLKPLRNAARRSPRLRSIYYRLGGEVEAKRARARPFAR